MAVSKKAVKRPQKQTHPVFTIRFTEGLATRNRLPLDHVIRVLTEIKGMIETAGKRIQRERGSHDPNGDFGLELVGGFQKGSVTAALMLTKNTEAGVLAASQVLDTVTGLNADTFKPSRHITTTPRRTELDPRLVTRLGNISKVQEIDKTRVEMRLVTPGTARPLTAVFDRRTTAVINKLREPNFAVEELTVYGKLRELRDKYDDDDESKKAFFGELLGDDGIVYRVEFKPKDEDAARRLFRKQVAVTGNVTYYKAKSPLIAVTEIEPDQERDYESAFDELYGSSPELAKTDLKTLLRQLDSD